MYKIVSLLVLATVSFAFINENINKSHDFSGYISQYSLYQVEGGNKTQIGGASVIFTDGNCRSQIHWNDIEYTILQKSNQQPTILFRGKDGKSTHFKLSHNTWFPFLAALNNKNIDQNRSIEQSTINDSKCIVYKITDGNTYYQFSIEEQISTNYIPFLSNHYDVLKGLLHSLQLTDGEHTYELVLTHVKPGQFGAQRFEIPDQSHQANSSEKSELLNSLVK